jgi:hypothetical protein
MAQRDASFLARLSELQADARAEEWTDAQLVCARLAMIRPRRAEVNALGRAYLDALAPGAIDAAHRLRSAGVAIGLSSDVAAESLFGVATALGVMPEDLYAPTVRSTRSAASPPVNSLPVRVRSPTARMRANAPAASTSVRSRRRSAWGRVTLSSGSPDSWNGTVRRRCARWIMSAPFPSSPRW